MNKYIDKLQDDIAIYLRAIENESFDSTEYLELKVNNYLISIKEDVIYEFYKYLQKEDYEIDVIEEHKNRLSTKLEGIDIKLVDNKYYKLKESLTQKMEGLNTALNILIDAKAEYNANIGNINYIESKRVKLDNSNKNYSEKFNDFVKSVENLGIIKIDYFVISKGLDKDLNSTISNARILKRKYKRECDIIQDQIDNQLVSRRKVEFLKSVNNALQTIINILKEEINNVNPNGSDKEENYIENNYYSREERYSLYKNKYSYDKYREEQYNDVYIKKKSYSEKNQEPVYVTNKECNEEETYVVDNNYSYEDYYSNKSTYTKEDNIIKSIEPTKSIEGSEMIEIEKVTEATPVVGVIRSFENTEDTKTYKEKEEIKNILITTSAGRNISISIDACKANMKEVSFNRAMAAINKLIRE